MDRMKSERANKEKETVIKYEAPEGYDTISASANPFNPSAGLYAAIDILDGKDVPNVMIHPVGIVTKDDVDHLPGARSFPFLTPATGNGEAMRNSF